MKLQELNEHRKEMFGRERKKIRDARGTRKKNEMREEEERKKRRDERGTREEEKEMQEEQAR